MSEPSLVSCIIPTFNRPKALRCAIQSVHAQTVPVHEILVVNDSGQPVSQFGTLNEKAPVRLLSTSEHRRGASAARNIGLEHASGNFIAFLDDDDEWLPTKLEKQLPIARQHGAASCNAFIPLRKGFIPRLDPVRVTYRTLLSGNWLGSCSRMIFRTEMVSHIRFDEQLSVAQDWDFWLTVMEKNGMPFIDNVQELLVFHNFSSRNRISDQLPSRKRSSFDRVREKRSQHFDSATLAAFMLNGPLSDDRRLATRLRRLAARLRCREGKNFGFLYCKFKELVGHRQDFRWIS